MGRLSVPGCLPGFFLVTCQGRGNVHPPVKKRQGRTAPYRNKKGVSLVSIESSGSVSRHGCSRGFRFMFLGHQMEPAYFQACAWAQVELGGGTQPEALVAGLMQQGWSELQAREVLDAALTNAPVIAAPRRAAVRSRAAPVQRPRRRTSSGGADHATNMVVGALICGTGIAITAGTYALAHSNGGVYIICSGAIIFGFIRFVQGFAGWMIGR